MSDFKNPVESSGNTSGIKDTFDFCSQINESHEMVEIEVQSADEDQSILHEYLNRTSEIKEMQEMAENDSENMNNIEENEELQTKQKHETPVIHPDSLSKTGNDCRDKETGRKKEKCSEKGDGSKIRYSRNELEAVSSFLAEARNACEKKGDGSKRRYSRNELEAMRFVNDEEQRIMWNEIYLGLGPVVAQELEDMGDSKHQKQGRRNVDHRQRFGKKKDAAKNLSEACVQNMENNIKEVKPLDPACADHLYGENGYTIVEVECSENGDSDDEYSSIQRPAFFVKGEPNFESGPPQDGLEYLRRVRWEAAQIPKVKVAKLDRNKLNNEQTVYMPKIPDIAKCPEHLLPSKQWEDAFLADFSELRLALLRLEGLSPENSDNLRSLFTVHEDDSFQPFQNSSLEISDDPQLFLTIDEVDSCPALHCTGLEKSDGLQSCSTVDEDGSFQPLENTTPSTSDKLELPLISKGDSTDPTVAAILGMDSVSRVSILKRRINSLETASTLSRNECAWIFALCGAIDTPLDADTGASLRCLLRKCSSLRAGKSETDDEVVMLNMLVTISGRYFRQLEN
ncbi:hypothetical protein HHK36_028770 [Tetracentron sinense]|uniref:Gem-associated protein 2 n=1 Tax=Tetracentron sinense TaxID=13715 RepID=A0A834YG04_TETSI|nr:hypothetical protein HHK36_028770 [Tetracentron sinense]